MLPFCSSSGDFAASVNVKELPQPSTSVGQTQRVFFNTEGGSLGAIFEVYLGVSLSKLFA